MKKISVVIPCYNDSKSIQNMRDRLTSVFSEKLTAYDYEIIFVDDHSPDNTWDKIREVCAQDTKCKGVRNAKNFGFSRNVFACLKDYGDGDAVFMLFGDLQDPPENLPLFVEKWEQGSKVVVGQKLKSKENRFIYSLRTLYYKIIGTFSQVSQVQHFNGYGLYDRCFIEVMQKIQDPMPYLKGIVSEFAMDMSIVNYEQFQSERGKSNANFAKNYDLAMQGITAYTKTFMRMATFVGAILGIISVIMAIVVFVLKIINWDTYPIGTPSLLIGVFLIGAVQLFFLGIMGEYILSINTRSLNRPIVVVGEKLNFERENKNELKDTEAVEIVQRETTEYDGSDPVVDSGKEQESESICS
ncbi:MAG: glycosyltransferase [Oscillospiraceae bacterium]|nr:glycosyltransferase [Oscillospiraceae bacterium]